MTKKVIGIIVVIVVIATAVIAVKRLRAKGAPHPEVKTAVAEMGDVSSIVSATGTLQAFTMVDVKSKAGGKVVKMAVEEGTVVKPGQLICLIDRTDNQTVYDQAAADVRSASSSVQQARENLRYQGATLGPQIQQSVESLRSAQVKLKQAKEALALQKETSENQVEQARQALAAAKARLDQAQAQAQVQPDLTRGSIAQAQASLKSAQENLSQLKTAKHPQERASAQADVDQARSDVATNKKNFDRLQELLAKGFASQSQVDTAENQWIAAKARLLTTLAKLDTLKDQQSAELRDFQAKVEQASASLSNARTNSVQDSLRRKDFEASRASYRQAQVALADAEANRKQVALKEQDVRAAEAAARQAEASLKNVQANSIQSRVKAEDVRQAMARMLRARITANNAKVNLDQTTVVAPFKGIVLKKYVDEGTIIQSGLSSFSSGSPIVQVADTSRMYVDTQVDEADIGRIEPGQPVKITLDAYPNSPKEGKVRKLYPQAQVDQNVTYVHVQVEVDSVDIDERLRPAMNATCEFLVDQKKNVLTVPSEAVKDVRNATEVTVIKDPKKPLWEPANQDKREVEIGLRGDDRTEIKSGLKAGDTVVTLIIQPITAQMPGGPGGAPRGPMGGMGGGGMRR